MYASWLVGCPGEESFSAKGRSRKLSEYVSPHWRCQEINGMRGRSSRASLSDGARRTETGKLGGIHSGGAGIAARWTVDSGSDGKVILERYILSNH